MEKENAPGREQERLCVKKNPEFGDIRWQPNDEVVRKIFDVIAEERMTVHDARNLLSFCLEEILRHTVFKNELFKI